MPELYLEAALAFLLLASASYRFRRDAGVDHRSKAALRLSATCLFVLMLARSGTTLGGERVVRTLIACSLAAVTVVLALSLSPAAVLSPIRAVMVRARRGAHTRR